MSKKPTDGVNVEKAISRIAKPSIFDRIVKEIDAREIPAKYIEQIRVYYHDGNVTELSGKELTHPIPVNRNSTWEMMEDSFKKIKDIRIYINTEVLESDINQRVEKLLSKYV